MKLYAGSATEFIQLNIQNKLADILREQFLLQFGYNPSQNEVMSWRNSLFRLSDILERQNLNEQGVMVEYKLPLSAKRIDVVIYGHDELTAFIYNRVGAGEGMSILDEVAHSKLRPSKKLLKQVSDVIKQKLNGELQLFGRAKAKGDYILLNLHTYLITITYP